MAKQTGPAKLEGTIDNICFYKMGEEYYARLKSSLTGKRVKKDPRFRRTMEYAGTLAQASKIASVCYSSISKEERVHTMYRALTGLAMRLLKAGKDAAEIIEEITPSWAKAAPSETEITPSEKIPIARPRMLVDGQGKLIFTTLSCSETNTVRLKTGQPEHHQPLIINTITTGIPFVPN